jgi:[ribosomal protein S5]-alanine N-acetyltransferase
MSVINVETKNLKLVPQTREDVRAYIEQMPPHEKASVSPAWLALLNGSSSIDPWIHGFGIVHRTTGSDIGKCGFKGPPDADGVVEIAYGVSPEHEGKGYATEAAEALTNYAFDSGVVRLVRAHTLPERNASARVLTKCGFQLVGEAMDPEDGLVWRWERSHGGSTGRISE